MATAPTPITALPDVPLRSSPSNFAARADNFLGALPVYGTQLNAIAQNVYANAAEAFTKAAEALASAAIAANKASEASSSAAQAAASASGLSAAVASATASAASASDDAAQVAQDALEIADAVASAQNLEANKLNKASPAFTGNLTGTDTAVASFSSTESRSLSLVLPASYNTAGTYNNLIYRINFPWYAESWDIGVRRGTSSDIQSMEWWFNGTTKMMELTRTGALNVAGALTQAGNQVLHAGNYNTYAPTKSGTGATGLWGISVTGNAYGITSLDTRASNPAPGGVGAVLRADFKTNTTDGLNDGGTYHGVVTFQQYPDASGGGARQLGFTDNDNLWLRGSGGALSAWGSWKLVLNSFNYNAYAPTLTGSGASGTWGISVTGNAATTSQRLFSGDLASTGQGRFTGWYTGGVSTAPAVELGISGGEGFIYGYRRDATPGYLPLNISGGAGAVLRLSAGAVNVTSGALQQGNNQVLHAGNYGSYALPLAGGTLTGWLSATAGSRLVIQNGIDGGNGYGIFMWAGGDPNWGIYMATAGVAKSLASSASTPSIDGRTQHHIRFRVGGGATGGFLWENSSEQALMSLTADTGNLYVKGDIYVGNSTANKVLHSGNYSGYTQEVTNYFRITAVGGIQRLLMGNQDSSGVNNPSILAAANGDFLFGRGSSWSGDGGVFTFWAKVTSEGLKVLDDRFIDIGPNSGWGATLRVGGNSHTGTSRASIATSNGNLHIDAKAGNATYLNYFAGSSVHFGNALGSGIVGTIDAAGNTTFDGKGTFSSGRIGAAAGQHVNYDSNQIWALTGGASSPLYLQYSSNGNTIINQIGGNVGIGTGTPATRFAVSNGGGAGVEINPSGALNDSPYIQAFNRASSVYAQLSFIADNYRFYVNGGSGWDTFVITSSSTIGIGTSSPSSKLHVNGVITAAIGTMLQDAGNHGAIYSDSNNIAFFTNGGYVFANRANNAGRMELSSAGNLTVHGTGTSSFAGALSVGGVNLANMRWLQSARDFPNGTLIETDIPISSGDVWLLEVKGYNYLGGQAPTNFTVAGYIYDNGVYYNGSAQTTGLAPPTINIFSLNGYLCFWWTSQSYWQGFDVFCSAVTGSGRKVNRTTAISNAVVPAARTMATTVTNMRVVLDSGNFSTYTAGKNGNGYLIPENWVQFNGNYGLYAPYGDAHFLPNQNGSYGAWEVRGSKNGWGGLYFSTQGVNLMITQTQVGFHNGSVGDWQFLWSSGTLYCYKGSAGGGSAATVLDSINYTNYALPAAGGSLNGNLTVTNYGLGMVGLYSDVRYQSIFSMGASYTLPAGGLSTANFYGIAWTHSNIGGQSKAGLQHQALFMTGGVTYTAIGDGIWTRGNVTTLGTYYGSGAGLTGTAPSLVAGNASNANNATNANYALDSGALGGVSSNRAMLKRRAYIGNDSGASLNSNIGAPEMGFTYGGSGEPAGPFIAFGGLGGNIDYSCQLVAGYSVGGSNFVMRTRNDDLGIWNPWRTLIHDGNITSYNAGNVTGVVAVANGGTGATYRMGANGSVVNWGQIYTHAAVTNFNAVADFGHTFVNLPASNGPVANVQFYQTLTSLGAEYPAGAYGMQTAIQRGPASNIDYMYVRFNEASTWSTWRKLAAGYADVAESAKSINNIPFRNGNVTNPIGYDSILENGIGYVNGVSLFGQADGALYSQAWASSYVHQIFGDYRTGQLAVRGRVASAWTAWRTILDSSNLGSYTFAKGGGSNYLQADTWTQLNGYFGLFSSLNGAHFYPNNGTYGSWLIQGTRNGWAGLEFITGAALMMNAGEFGIYKIGEGWKIHWYDNSMRVGKAGGAEALVVDSANHRTIVRFGAPTTAGTADWNHVSNTTPGSGATLLLGTHANGPGNGIYYHPLNFEYSGTEGTGEVTQMAVAYATHGNELYMRGRYQGAWTGWVRFLNSSNISSYAVTVSESQLISGTKAFASTGGVGPSLGTCSLEAYSASGAAAMMSFHRGGHYAINMGLDADNWFRIGGWSDGNIYRLQIDPSGNTIVRGSLVSRGSPIVDVTASSSGVAAGYHYTISGGSATTLTLPGSPAVGDTVVISPCNGLSTNVIGRNGQYIHGLLEDMVMDNPQGTYTLKYLNATVGWRLM